jgi:hypothetical protein
MTMTMQGDRGIATAGCLLMITTNGKGGLPHEDEAKKRACIAFADAGF